MRLLVVNVGSSGVKLSVLSGGDLEAATTTAHASGRLDDAALEAAIGSHAPFDAVGHRIVHGGAAFTEAVVVDAEVRARLDALVDLEARRAGPAS